MINDSLSAPVTQNTIVADNSQSEIEKISEETIAHIKYLQSIGLQERGGGFKVKRLIIDLSPFEKRTPIPREVLDFDPTKKNTLITTDPDERFNRKEDLERVLDIRLYPALRKRIKEHGVEVFLGTKKEMRSYYKSNLLCEFSIPSSATYYLVQSKSGQLRVVMAGLVSRENVIAQLLTLKLARVNVENIEIIGEVDHFSRLVRKDIDALLKEMPELTRGCRALIVAGCGLEGKVSELVEKEFQTRLGKPQSFKGNIVSLTHIPLKEPINGVDGLISLNLNYGEIMEDIVKLLLENCNCKYVFTGGAGGYISRDATSEKPCIGERLSITQCMNESGELVSLGSSDHTHLQIPSIFLETYDWLEGAKKRGTSVDVETFYIIRAIQNYNKQNPSLKVEADCGIFVSDFVGEKPLREYSEVFKGYNKALSGFFKHIFRESKVYNPKDQTADQIKITKSEEDPKVPHAPRMDTSFLSELSLSKDEILKLNPGRSTEELFKNKPWNIDYYNRLNYPVVVGAPIDRQVFSQKRGDIGLRFLDMPIHMPGQGFRIPPELEQFKEVIQMAIAFEKTVDPDFEKKCYVYITVDQGEVEPKAAQRRTGWHGDSYLRIDTRKTKVDVACDHVYVIADNCSTPFLPGPFSLKGIDPENIDEVLAQFSKTAEDKVPNYYPDCTMLRVDPYCVHNVGFNMTGKTLFRTFVKISVSQSKYCKLGNAVNPLFIYDWPMVPRHNVPYDNSSLHCSSHRKDRDKFKEINPNIIDFTKDDSRIKTAIRCKEVFAEPAKEGEILRTINDGFLTTILVAEKGDWKITASHNDQYFLSEKKLKKFYQKDSHCKGKFVPKPLERRVIELEKDVRFYAPWGTLVYARKGDMLMCAGKDDIYSVPRALFDDEFKIKGN